MKRITLLAFTFLIISCGQRTNNKTTEKNINSPKAEQISSVNDSPDKFIGTFEFVYPYNTSDLIENQYIVLWKNESQYHGLYYGTSDEFDESREGYIPGFFVAPLEKLVIDGDTIKFTLSVKNKDIFDKAVDLKYKSADEARQNGYENWIQDLEFEPRDYFGIVKDNSIEFKGYSDKREFKKIK
jgi:hypothetical protein